MLPQPVAAALTIRSSTPSRSSSTRSRHPSSRSIAASSSGSLPTGGSFGEHRTLPDSTLPPNLASAERATRQGSRPPPVGRLGDRIRRRSVTRVPSLTRSKLTSSTKQRSNQSPHPRPLRRSVVGGGWGGWAGPWSTTVASTQAPWTQTATWTGSPPRDPYKTALVAASSRARTSSSATWGGTSRRAWRAARRRPPRWAGEAGIVSSTQHSLLGSSHPCGWFPPGFFTLPGAG